MHKYSSNRICHIAPDSPQIAFYEPLCNGKFGQVHMYRMASNFGGSKFWLMTQILRFGKFNFGIKCLAHVLLQ